MQIRTKALCQPSWGPTRTVAHLQPDQAVMPVGRGAGPVINPRGLARTEGLAPYGLGHDGLGPYVHCPYGLVHRDLKPSNVVISDPQKLETVKIVDFGLAIKV